MTERTEAQRAYHRMKQREYRASGKTAEAERKPCVVCGGRKPPGRGFRTCGECWGPSEDKSLEQLIREQAQDMALG